MVNVLLAKHSNEIPFRTYNRGKKAIDLPLCCLQALQLIKAVGILKFYRILPTDHRSLYIDLVEKWLMTQERDETKRAFNVPSLLKPSTAVKFIAKYKQLLDKANLFQKVQQISNRMEIASPSEMPALIDGLNKYDQVWVQLIMAATAQTTCKLGGTKLWSPALAKYGSITRYWNSRVRLYTSTGQIDSTNIVNPLGYTPQQAEDEDSMRNGTKSGVQQTIYARNTFRIGLMCTRKSTTSKKNQQSNRYYTVKKHTSYTKDKRR